MLLHMCFSLSLTTPAPSILHYSYRYPYCIERVIILNAPWVFNACWSFIQGLIPATAGDIFNFANTQEELECFLPKESIPEQIAFLPTGGGWLLGLAD